MHEAYEAVEPRYDLQAERCTLGSILLEEEVFDQADEALQGEEFFSGQHRDIFQAMRDVRDEGQPINIITLCDKLGASADISYMTDLTSIVPSAREIMSYVRIVKKHYAHRVALAEVRRIASKAEQSDDVTGLIADMNQAASNLSDKVAPKKEFLSLRDAVIQVYEQVEYRWHHRSENGVTGLASGFPDLDRVTAGFQKTDLIIVAARPSVGKTAFALNIATGVAVDAMKKQSGERVAIFSLEMSANQLVQRMICAEGNVDASRMRTGYLEGDDWEKITMAIGTLSEMPVVIDDTAGISIQEIYSKCRRLKKNGGLGMVVIDYLQLIQSKGRKHQSRQEEVSEIARQLKNMAKDLDVPVIALSQLSRGVEQRQDKRPMLSDLRESGEIEQAADIVSFLYRDDYYDKESERKGIIEIIIAKQRNGPVGTVELAFMKNFNKFVSLDRGHHEEPKDVHYRPDHEPTRGRGA